MGEEWLGMKRLYEINISSLYTKTSTRLKQTKESGMRSVSILLRLKHPGRRTSKLAFRLFPRSKRSRKPSTHFLHTHVHVTTFRDRKNAERRLETVNERGGMM